MLLPEIVLSVIEIVEPAPQQWYNAPPSTSAWLLESTLFVMFTVIALQHSWIPPPSSPAVLLFTVEFVRVTVELSRALMAPPSLDEELPLMLLFVMVRTPLLIRMPAPWLEEPLVMVRPSNEAEAPVRTSNTLSIAPPLMVVAPTPAPPKDMLARIHRRRASG